MFKRVLFIGCVLLLAGVLLFITLMAGSLNSGTATRPNTLTPQSSPPPPGKLNSANPNAQKLPADHIGGFTFLHTNAHGQVIKTSAKDLQPRPQGVIDADWPAARIYLHPWQMIEIRARRGTFVAPDQNPRSGDFQGRVVLTVFESDPKHRLDDSPDSHDIQLRLFMQDTRFDLELGTIDSDSDVHLTSPRIDFRGTGLHLNYNEGKSRIEHLLINKGKELRIKPAEQASAGGPQRSSAPATSPATAPAPQYFVATIEHAVHIHQNDVDITGDHLWVYFAIGGGNQDQMLRGLSQRDHDSNAGPPAALPNVTFAANTPQLAATYLRQCMLAQLPRATGPTTSPAAAPVSMAAPLPDDQTMTPVGGDDVTIKWTGPLTIDPIENPPPEIEGPEDRMLRIDGQPMTVTTGRHETITGAKAQYLTHAGRITVDGSDAFPMVINSQEGELHGPRLVIDQSKGTGQVPGAGSLRAHNAAAPGEAAAAPAGAVNAPPPDMVVKWSTSMDLTFYGRTPGSAPTPGSSPARGSAEKVSDTFSAPPDTFSAPPGSSPGTAPSSASGVPKPSAVGGATDVHREANAIRKVKTIQFVGDVDVQQDPQFHLRADRMTLALDDPSKGRQTLQQITASNNVHVTGQADAEGGQLDVDTDELNIDMVQDVRGRPEPSMLHARGHVRAQEHAKTGDESITAGLLDVGLAPAAPHPAAAPHPQPAAAANAGASVDAGGGTLSMGGAAAHRFAVRTMHAQDNVEVKAQGGEMHILADHIDAQVDPDALHGKDNIQVFGTAAAPARMLHAQDSLTSKTMLVTLDHADKTGQTIDVPGPGTFVFFTKPTPPGTAPGTAPAPGKAGAPGAPGAPGPASKPAPNAPPSKMVVTWKDKMRFNNHDGTADFFGSVVSRGDTGLKRNYLQCDQLHVVFASVDVPGAGGAAPKKLATAQTPPATGGAPLGDLGRGGQSIRSLTATKDVRLVAESSPEGQPTQLATRLTIDGPLMTFDNKEQMMRVVGPGHMLMEDYRAETPGTPGTTDSPAASAPAAHASLGMLGAAGTPGTPGIGATHFTGRGNTFFTWAGQLTFNTHEKLLTIEKKVQMVHGPNSKTVDIQLDCRTFAANLSSAEGMGGLMGDAGPAPSITEVRADDDVRILGNGRVIRTDHLDYVHSTQVIALRANDGGMTEITDADDKKPEDKKDPPMIAQEFRWNFARGSFEVIGPGVSQRPIPETNPK